MKAHLALLLGVFLLQSGKLPLPAQSGPPRMLVIGEPGNPADLNGYGSVAYRFEITRERITHREYTAFLNHADPQGENVLALYHESMGSSPQGGIILNENAPAGQRYQLMEERADTPVVHINWLDAARYANWLSNGGDAESATEWGAYPLASSQGRPTGRTPGARYYIANENEWYKAAWYHIGENGNGSSGYSRVARWSGSVRDREVSELVDPAPEGVRPVAAGRELIFRYVQAVSPAVERNATGFRLVRLLDTPTPSGKEIVALDGKEIDPPPVGEQLGDGGGGYGPSWLGGPGLWPAPIYVIDEDDFDPDIPPAS